MKGRKRLRAVSIVALGILAVAGCSSTKTSGSASTSVKFPTGPITLVVPFAAGGSVDADARVIAQGMAKQLGQPVSVVDQTGGSTGTALADVMAKPADGYTVFAESIGYMAQLIDSKKIPYTMSSVAPVGLLGGEDVVLFSKAGSPWTTLASTIAWAKAHPGQLTVTGTGTVGGLAATARAFIADTHINAIFAPTQGGSATVPYVLGGHADLGVITPSVILPQLQASKVNVLAVSSTSAYPTLPGVPTFQQSGYNIQFGSNIGLLVRSGTPAPIINKLWAAAHSVLQSASFASFAKKRGFIIKDEGPAGLNQYMSQSIQRYKGVSS